MVEPGEGLMVACAQVHPIEAAPEPVAGRGLADLISDLLDNGRPGWARARLSAGAGPAGLSELSEWLRSAYAHGAKLPDGRLEVSMSLARAQSVWTDVRGKSAEGTALPEASFSDVPADWERFIVAGLWIEAFRREGRHHLLFVFWVSRGPPPFPGLGSGPLAGSALPDASGIPRRRWDVVLSDLAERSLPLVFHAAGVGFLQTEAAGTQVELPTFISVFPVDPPREPGDYLRGGRLDLLFDLTADHLGTDDPLASDVSGAFLEGSHLALFHEKRAADGETERLKTYSLLLPALRRNDWEGMEGDYAYIVSKMSLDTFDACRDVAKVRQGRDLGPPIARLRTVGIAAAHVPSTIDRVQELLPRARSRRHRQLLFSVADHAQGLLRTARLRLAAEATENDALVRGGREVVEDVERSALSGFTLRRVEGIKLPHGLDLAPSPVREMKDALDRFHSEAVLTEERIARADEAVRAVIEQERRDDLVLAEERQRRLGVALAVVAILTAFPLLVGQVDAEALRGGLARLPAPFSYSSAFLGALQPWLLLVAATSAFASALFLVYSLLPGRRRLRETQLLRRQSLETVDLLSSASAQIAAAPDMPEGERARLDDECETRLAAFLKRMHQPPPRRWWDRDSVATKARELEREAMAAFLGSECMLRVPMPLALPRTALLWFMCVHPDKYGMTPGLIEESLRFSGLPAPAAERLVDHLMSIPPGFTVDAARAAILSGLARAHASPP